ncbi:MAG TPA: DUF58 domain-containing protein, partial [bacterium]|nr:DUF58 domain-containing protein [bacterium]
GDDLRYLDWKILGKRDRFYIREFVAETNLNALILLDISSSMNYKNKFDYACVMAASLAYLLLSGNDAVGLIAFHEREALYLPPQTGMGYFHQFVRILETLEPAGKTDISSVISQLGWQMKRRSLLIFISDFWDETEKYISLIKVLKKKKNEIIAFHLLHPDETELPQGYFRFRDEETGTEMNVDADLFKKEYDRLLEKHTQELRHHFRLADIDHRLFSTGGSMADDLSDWLSRRTKK